MLLLQKKLGKEYDDFLSGSRGGQRISTSNKMLTQWNLSIRVL